MTTAIKFIQDHGIDRARGVVEGAPEGAELFHTNTYLKNVHSEGKTDHFARWSGGFKDWVQASADRNFIDESIVLEELKRLVESVDLVKKCDGIDSIKDTFDFAWAHGSDELTEYGERLKQAVADYEAIYGGEHV